LAAAPAVQDLEAVRLEPVASGFGCPAQSHSIGPARQRCPVTSACARSVRSSIPIMPHPTVLSDTQQSGEHARTKPEQSAMDRNSFRDDLAFSIGFVIQQNRALLRWSIWRWRDSRSTRRSNSITWRQCPLGMSRILVAACRTSNFSRKATSCKVLSAGNAALRCCAEPL
jgi:hypothetical protein